MTDAELVRAAIDASGLSVRGFARCLTRNPSTVWKWLRGQHPPPLAVKEYCKRLAELGKPAQ